MVEALLLTGHHSFSGPRGAAQLALSSPTMTVLCAYVGAWGGREIGVSKLSQDWQALTCPVGDPRRTWGEYPACCWLAPPRW